MLIGSRGFGLHRNLSTETGAVAMPPLRLGRHALTVTAACDATPADSTKNHA